MGGNFSFQGSWVMSKQLIPSQLCFAHFAINHFWMKMFSISTKKENDISKLLTNPWHKISKKSQKLKVSLHRGKGWSWCRWPSVKHGSLGCCSWWTTPWSKLKTKSVKSNRRATPKSRKNADNKPPLKCYRKLRQLSALMNLTMKINFSTIRSRCRWAGTVNLFHTGFISSTVWVKSLSVRFVVGLHIGVAEHSKSIFRSGDTLMAWSVWEFRIHRTSKMSLKLSTLWVWIKKWCNKIWRGLLNQTSRRNSRTRKAICTHASSSSIWGDRASSD